MTREQALKIADALVSGWTAQVKNERGYVHDKWAPVDIAARTEAVLKVAAFLLVPSGPLVAPARPAEPERPTLFGWHPEAGVPRKSQYQAARGYLTSLESGEIAQAPVEAAELARQLIDAYELAAGS